MRPFLQNRAAVVTGGYSGMGLDIAGALLEHGARVAIGARVRRVEDAAIKSHPAVARLSARAGSAAALMALRLDVTDSESVDAFMARVKERFGAIDILVNCAGIYLEKPLRDHSEDDWTRTIDTNLNGAYRMIRACMPDMSARGFGRIVSIASTAAHTAMPDNAAYCASKAGLKALGRVAALEGAAHGVVSVTISPGWVETEMMAAGVERRLGQSGNTRSREQVVAELRAANPQNRLVQCEEISALVIYLCRDEAASLNGEDIVISGGSAW